jgi:hypothetical protein
MNTPKRCYDEDYTDLTSLSYEEWERYVFERAHINDFDVCYTHPERLVEYMTRMCRDFRSIGERYTLEQINEGIWFLLGAAVEFGECLLLTEIPLQKRLECIRAMYHPFADFLAGHPAECMENCFYMWWDFIADNCFSFQDKVQVDWKRLQTRSERSKQPLRETQQLWEQTYRDASVDKRAVLDCTLEVLVQILRIDDIRCQGAALHGLGHLRHPRRAAIVQEYIEKHRHLWSDNTDCLRWLRHCRDGVVM